MENKDRNRRRADSSRSLTQMERQLSVDLGVPDFLFKLADVRRLRLSLERDRPRVRRD